MIIFAHSKCKRYENRKIQGVALPQKERIGQEWKSSHHGTHHGEQDYGAVFLQVVLQPFALESSCQPFGGQEQGSRGDQQGHRPVAALHPKGFRGACGKENGLRGKGCQGGFTGQRQDTDHPSLFCGRTYQ